MAADGTGKVLNSSQLVGMLISLSQRYGTAVRSNLMATAPISLTGTQAKWW